ncbi:MAG TPA: hypothetical protein VIF84_04090, partial [Candidatus Limnocylindrales bacterium]
MTLDLGTTLHRGFVLERLAWLDAVAPLDAAERLCGMPGLTLLESARPGRRARWSYLAADPLAVLDLADDGPQPLASARRMLARMAAGPFRPTVDGDALPGWT